MVPLFSFLDDEIYGPSKRRTKKSSKHHVRRRSGSLSRVLSVMGKGIRAIARGGGGGGASGQTPFAKSDSVHSTPLPLFGTTPDFSPRAQVKRKVKPRIF